MLDYINDFDNKELEKEYGVYFGAINRMAEQIGWVLEAAACIAKVIAVRTSTRKLLEGLSSRIAFGVPQDGVFLARLGIPCLGRERIRSLVRFGVDSPETLQEVTMSDLEKMVTKPVAARLFAWLEQQDLNEEPTPTSGTSTMPSQDASGRQSPILKIIGETDRRRSSIELNGHQMMLRDREFELLIRLAKARVLMKGGWISKFDLNLPDGGITQGISRLREAIRGKLQDVDIIESDHEGSYRLNLRPDSIHFVTDTLMKHWSATVRELCEAA